LAAFRILIDAQDLRIFFRLDDDFSLSQLLFQAKVFFFQLVNAFGRGIPGLGELTGIESSL